MSLFLAASQICLGQTAEQSRKIIPSAGCPRTANFEREGYLVRSSRINDPFGFLRLVRSKELEVSKEIAALVDGKPFRYDTAVTQALEQIEAENFLPDTSDARVRVWLEFVSVENCAGRDLDLVYRVYSAQVPPVLTSTPESRATEKKAPQATVGLAGAGNPIQFTPAGGYNASESAFGGGRVEITSKRVGWLPFQSFVAEGRGSSTMRLVSAGLSGSSDSKSWLAHADWLLNYTNSSSPTGNGPLNQGRLSVHFSSVTKAFANGNLTGRFGGLIEGGNLQSALPGATLAPDTVPSAGYGALKLYTGLDSRLQHNVLSVSYGLELGSIGPAARVDWRKQIGDVRHEFWHALGDHHILELESRFTAGGIQVPGSIPLPARFFGGSREESFIPGDSWKIRANPVIRAIPANRFYRTGDGAGGDSFVSYNLTVAWAAWRHPLIPPELTKDAKFEGLLNGQINTATSIEQVSYASKDRHYAIMVSRLPDVRQALARLKAAVRSAQSVQPDQLKAEFKACTAAISMADLRAKGASESKELQQYGRLSALLPVDPHEDRLTKVIQKCGTDLNTRLNDVAIRAAVACLDSVFNAMQDDFKQINQPLAKERATEDMAFVRRTLDTLFKEVNIYSVSPVVVFDVARIGPQKGGLGGVRYGPGGGVRLGLVSSVSFTLGYAWNPSHRPSEGPGAVFFSIEVRDLFH